MSDEDRRLAPLPRGSFARLQQLVLGPVRLGQGISPSVPLPSKPAQPRAPDTSHVVKSPAESSTSTIPAASPALSDQPSTTPSTPPTPTAEVDLPMTPDDRIRMDLLARFRDVLTAYKTTHASVVGLRKNADTATKYMHELDSIRQMLPAHLLSGPPPITIADVLVKVDAEERKLDEARKMVLRAVRDMCEGRWMEEGREGAKEASRGAQPTPTPTPMAAGA